MIARVPHRRLATAAPTKLQDNGLVTLLFRHIEYRSESHLQHVNTNKTLLGLSSRPNARRPPN